MISYIPQNSIAKSISIYLKGYGIWLLCSILIGLGLALLFSHNRYEMFLELTDHNEKLQAERDVLQRESCLYELLSKKMVDEDALWKKCLKNQIYVNRKYKFFVVVTADKLGNLWYRYHYGYNYRCGYSSHLKTLTVSVLHHL